MAQMAPQYFTSGQVNKGRYMVSVFLFCQREIKAEGDGKKKKKRHKTICLGKSTLTV